MATEELNRRALITRGGLIGAGLAIAAAAPDTTKDDHRLIEAFGRWCAEGPLLGLTGRTDADVDAWSDRMLLIELEMGSIRARTIDGVAIKLFVEAVHRGHIKGGRLIVDEDDDRLWNSVVADTARMSSVVRPLVQVTA